MKKLKTFSELNELSRELINRTSDAMISRGQNRRARNLVNSYNDANFILYVFLNLNISTFKSSGISTNSKI